MGVYSSVIIRLYTRPYGFLQIKSLIPEKEAGTPAEYSSKTYLLVSPLVLIHPFSEFAYELLAGSRA